MGAEVVKALVTKAAADPLLAASQSHSYKPHSAKPKAPEKGITIKVGEAYRPEEEAKAQQVNKTTKAPEEDEFVAPLEEAAGGDIQPLFDFDDY